MEQTYTYTARIEPAEEGGFNAFIPTLGCATWGRNYEEAMAMARECAEGYIESLQKNGDAVPVEPESASFLMLGVKVHVPA